MTTAEKMKLEELLKKASDAYYNDSPIMTDTEFDGLCDTLRSIDPDNEFLKSIGAKSVSVWPKVKHKYMMGSQSKIKTKEELKKWISSLGEVVITDKLDGSTIVLTYVNGQLQSAVTRGDGLEGEDITVNVLNMKNVRKSIPDFTGVLRGEMVAHVSDFTKYLKPNGYKNARNAANGIARDKDGSMSKYVTVIYFDVYHDSMSSEVDKQKFIKSHGLEYVNLVGPYSNVDDVWKAFEDRLSNRSSLDYEIDGMIVKLNDLDKQKELGDLNGRPRGQIAIKPEAQSATTKIVDIQWQVGNNGRISPVAIVEPTDIGGVTITRCTLNNIDYINTLGASIGSDVVLTRANDVIPAITGCTTRGTGATNQPKNCPTCKEKLERDGAYLICVMIECQGKVIGSLMAWLNTIKLKGVGPNIVRNLVDLGITDQYGLVTAEREIFRKACNSDKNGDKIYDQIQASKTMDLATFLDGLNIAFLGTTNSKRIAKHFKTLRNVLDATIDDMAEIQGIKTTASDIVDGLNLKKSMILDLEKEITITGTSGTGPLSGYSMCITGELWAPREEIHDMMRQKGIEAKSSVSKDLSFLVTDDVNSGSGKNAKAAKYGVKIIDGKTLRGILDGTVDITKL